ncbi:MAG: ABC transporter permease [Chloroflexota bacterium]
MRSSLPGTPGDTATLAITGRLARPVRSPGTLALHAFGRRWDAVAAAIALVVIALLSAAAPLVSGLILGTDPDAFMRTPDGRIAVLRPPGPGYPLGTDELGRDNLTRLVYAGRVSLTVAVLVAVVSLTVGTLLGMLAGYYRGRTDDVVNAFVQFVANIPSLFVLILLSVLFTPGVIGLALIFGFFYWPGTARQVRGTVLAASARDYVEAARVLGASDARVLARHVLPNVVSVVIVVAGLDVAAAILGESVLSFLGFGVPIPLSSWGNMLSGSQETFRSAPWLVYPPGVMIFITVLCTFTLADGLRDALDPRTRD